MAKTPAITAAERAGVAVRVHEYTRDEAAGSYGLEAVEKLGVDPGPGFKPLVVSVDGRLEVASVPATAQLDLKAVGKRAELADMRRAESATGYVAGGISPLGQRKRLPLHLDASALEHQTIFVSAGR